MLKRKKEGIVTQKDYIFLKANLFDMNNFQATL